MWILEIGVGKGSTQLGGDSHLSLVPLSSSDPAVLPLEDGGLELHDLRSDMLRQEYGVEAIKATGSDESLENYGPNCFHFWWRFCFRGCDHPRVSLCIRDEDVFGWIQISSVEQTFSRRSCLHCDPLSLPILPPSTNHRVGGAYFQGNVRSGAFQFIERLLLPDGSTAKELGVIPVSLPGFRLRLPAPVQDVGNAKLPVLRVDSLLALNQKLGGCLGQAGQGLQIPSGVGEVELLGLGEAIQGHLSLPEDVLRVVGSLDWTESTGSRGVQSHTATLWCVVDGHGIVSEGAVRN